MMIFNCKRFSKNFYDMAGVLRANALFYYSRTILTDEPMSAMYDAGRFRSST